MFICNGVYLGEPVTNAERLSWSNFKLLGAIAFGGATTFDDVSFDSPFNGESISIKGGGLEYAMPLTSSSGLINECPYMGDGALYVVWVLLLLLVLLDGQDIAFELLDAVGLDLVSCAFCCCCRSRRIISPLRWFALERLPVADPELLLPLKVQDFSI